MALRRCKDYRPQRVSGLLIGRDHRFWWRKGTCNIPFYRSCEP